MDVMTGCGLARADEHRRLLGGPQEHRVEEAFRAGALARGYSLDVIDEVWATLAAFGSFGFCKAHGAAFAVPTYHSAWLKTHHPEAFMAAILEHDPGMYPARLMVAEARRMGIPVLPVDVNASSRHVRVEWVPWHPELDGPPAEDAGAGGGEPGDVVARPHAEGGAEADLAEGAGRGPGRWGIRLPLTGLSGLSEAETERLDAGRPYRSLADVRDRARPTARNLERLAQLGALDCLLPAGGASRTDLVHHLELQHSATRGSGPGRAAARSRSARPRQVDGQLALDLPDTELAALTPLFPDPSVAARVRTELELTALDVTAHLMDSHAPYLDALGVTRAADLLGLRTQSRVLVAGVRVATQTPPMRSGKRVVFLSVDDGTGCVDASFFTEAQHASGEMLFSARLLLIEGTVRRTGPRAVSVQAVRAWDLHRPESLPDPDYLDATRRQWREWLAADRRAAAARRRGQEDAGAPACRTSRTTAPAAGRSRWPSAARGRRRPRPTRGPPPAGASPPAPGPARRGRAPRRASGLAGCRRTAAPSPCPTRTPGSCCPPRSGEGEPGWGSGTGAQGWGHRGARPTPDRRWSRAAPSELPTSAHSPGAQPRRTAAGDAPAGGGGNGPHPGAPDAAPGPLRPGTDARGSPQTRLNPSYLTCPPRAMDWDHIKTRGRTGRRRGGAP